MWARVGLGVVVAVALTQWPYAQTCGAGLLVYLLAVSTVLVTGVWGGMASWRGRLASAHVIALSTILWGLALVAHEILPRAGYSTPSASWWCAPDHGAIHGPSPGAEKRSGAPEISEAPDSIGGPSRTRTLDPLIKSQLLYQLS